VWLGLYILIAAVVPVADAGAPHADVVAHWEDASDTSCPPQHDASACQLCQLVTGAGRMPAVRGDLVPSAQGNERPAAAWPERVPIAVAVGGPSSRAPPVA
jgi:hypothetical protein